MISRYDKVGYDVSISGARAKVSNEQITTAIEQLNSEGIKPTIRAVRERLGNTGSPNRIQPLLAAWHDKINPVEAPAALSEGLQKALAELFACERKAAVASKLEDIDDLKEQISELATDGARLEDENAALQKQCEKLILEREQAVVVVAQKTQRIEQLEKEHQQLNKKIQQQTHDLATTLTRLDIQQKQNQQTHQQLEAAQARQVEAAQAVATAQQAAAVAEAKHQVRLEAISAAQMRIDKLEQQLDAAQAQAAVKLDDLQQRLDEVVRQRTIDAQNHTKAIAQRDEQLHTEHKKNAQLMTQIDELSDKILTLTSKSKH